MKFEKLDEQYLFNRKKISEKYGARELWSVIDHWPLYAGIKNLSRFIAIYEIIKKCIDVPGHLAEFGCWRGANLMYMAKLLKLMDPFGHKVVYGFESFEGLTQFSAKDFEANSQQGAYRGSEEELRDIISLYQLDDDISIQKGNIEKTLPELLENDKSLSFSLIYCDTDLFSSSKMILEQLDARLSKGGVFVFDEWNYTTWPGETMAVREFMTEHGESYEMINVKNASQPSLILKKIKI